MMLHSLDRTIRLHKPHGVGPTPAESGHHMGPKFLDESAMLHSKHAWRCEVLTCLRRIAQCADGVMYWVDVAETLAAFVVAFPPGGGLLMQRQGALAVQLSRVHDSLLPEVHGSLARVSAAGVPKVHAYHL